MAGYIGSKAVLLSTTAAEVSGDADIGGSVLVDTIKSDSGTTAMTIDSSGRILFLAQVRWQARGSNNAYVTTANIPLPTVDINIGSAYNNSTYKMTAPITGAYLCFVALYMRVDANGEAAECMFHKNDTQQNSLSRLNAHVDDLNTNGKWEGQSSMSQIIDLSSGDTLHVEFNSAGSGSADYYNGAAYSCFGGYLLG